MNDYPVAPYEEELDERSGEGVILLDCFDDVKTTAKFVHGSCWWIVQWEAREYQGRMHWISSSGFAVDKEWLKPLMDNTP